MTAGPKQMILFFEKHTKISTRVAEYTNVVRARAIHLILAFSMIQPQKWRTSDPKVGTYQYVVKKGMSLVE